MLPTLAITVLTAALLVAGWYGLPMLLRYYKQQNLARACREAKLIALTYDDGPGRKLTRDLIELLNRRNAQASFFLLGRNVEANSDAVSHLVAGPHELGTHSFNHYNAWKCGPFRNCKDIVRGQAVAATNGVSTSLFRPPHGKMTLASLALALLSRLNVVWWTIDSGDTWAELPDIKSVLKRIEKQGGGVVLLHDFDREPSLDPNGERAEFVLGLTDAIINYAQANGYQLVPVTRVLQAS